VPRNGAATRARILDVTERLVVEKGFADTSLDEIIAAAATTKGGLFHHFASKQDLGRAVIERYAAQDAATQEEMIRRGEESSADPLDQLLTYVRLMTDTVEEQFRTLPGCLFASFAYERNLVDDSTKQLIADNFRFTHASVRRKLDQVVERHPPRQPVDLDAIADQITTIAEGAFVMARILDDPAVVRAQMDQFRRYLELLFS